jgi:hypothetical protein
MISKLSGVKIASVTAPFSWHRGGPVRPMDHCCLTWSDAPAAYGTTLLVGSR